MDADRFVVIDKDTGKVKRYGLSDGAVIPINATDFDGDTEEMVVAPSDHEWNPDIDTADWYWDDDNQKLILG